MAPKLEKPIVAKNKPLANRGWKKHRVTCRDCNGTGGFASAVTAWVFNICKGCNGHGKVIVWRKDE